MIMLAETTNLIYSLTRFLQQFNIVRILINGGTVVIPIIAVSIATRAARAVFIDVRAVAVGIAVVGANTQHFPLRFTVVLLFR